MTLLSFFSFTGCNLHAMMIDVNCLSAIFNAWKFFRLPYAQTQYTWINEENLGKLLHFFAYFCFLFVLHIFPAQWTNTV